MHVAMQPYYSPDNPRDEHGKADLHDEDSECAE